MSAIEKRFEHWLESVDSKACAQLEELRNYPDNLHDAFYRELAFGTGGLRGIIGIGSNRMNTYTIGKATQGLANYLNAHFDHPSVAIARDSRNEGESFVRTAAEVLAANGIIAHVFPHIQPTPMLSFAVRDLGASAGINVTASHNPAEYNGYKVYGSDGCQIATQAAEEIQRAIDNVDCFADVERIPFDKAQDQGLIKWIDDCVVDRFIDAIASQSVEPRDAKSTDKLSVVYTPLNGTGLSSVLRILNRMGIDDVTVVPEQREPDGNFTTCPYPNPEMREALKCGLELCETLKPDLLLATDPDADRVGVAVHHEGEYVLLTGNEIGVLLIDYLATRRKERGENLTDKLVVTTIVSSLMPDAQALDHGFELRRVLTGFKYIGGQIALLEEAGHVDDFMFGFEESYGYLSGAHVRDKDAVNACMLICQMVQMHKDRGVDLVEAMEGLYKRYGYYLNETVNISYPGSDGAERMSAIMERLKTNPPAKIAGHSVITMMDFSQGAPMPRLNGKTDGIQTLPSADVVSFSLAEGVQILIRPSGTEPKIKGYVFSRGSSRDEAQALLGQLVEATQGLLN